MPRYYTAAQKIANLERANRWKAANPDRAKELARNGYWRHHDRNTAQARKHYAENIEAQRARCNAKNRALKLETLAAYGGVCTCCGEAHQEFLTIDHIYGRKKSGHNPWFGGANLYYWLKKRGFPKDDFRILCFNCNCSMGSQGYCPHQREKEAAA